MQYYSAEYWWFRSCCYPMDRTYTPGTGWTWYHQYLFCICHSTGESTYNGWTHHGVCMPDNPYYTFDQIPAEYGGNLVVEKCC